MILLTLGAVVAGLIGAGIAIGYGLGRSHGAAEARSVALEHRYKRCTPEPTRLRLLPNPLLEVSDDMPAAMRRNFEVINEEIAEGLGYDFTGIESRCPCGQAPYCRPGCGGPTRPDLCDVHVFDQDGDAG